MPNITKEQYSELPDFIQSNYELDGEEYALIAEQKVKSLKNSLNSINDKLEANNALVKQIEQEQKDKIEQAKREALESARSNSQVDEVEKIYKQQMEDLKARSEQSYNELKQQNESLLNATKTSAKKTAVSDIKNQLNVTQESAKLFEKLIMPMVDVDPITGKEIYLNDDGSASSLDRAGFISQIEKDPAYNAMRKAQNVSSGGMANGNSSKGGAHKTLKDMSWDEQAKLANDNPDLFKKLNEASK